MLLVGGFSFVGRGENVGMAFVPLVPWDKRDQTAAEVIDWANQRLGKIKEARIFAANLPVIRGLGQFGGFDFRIEDPAGYGHDRLMQARDQLIALAAKDPVLQGVRSNGLDDSAQLDLTVDRVQAQAMGVGVDDVYNTIQLMLAPVYANDFQYQGRVLRVELLADAPWRMSADSLQHFYVRSDKGAITSASGTPGLVRPSVSACVPRTRSASRGVLPIWANRAVSCWAVQPAFTYSTTLGSIPLSRIRARVLREVPQFGLWKMVTSLMAGA